MVFATATGQFLINELFLKIVFSIPWKRSVIDYGALSVLDGSGLS